MGKPTSAVKRKYNKSNYRRYEFSVKLGTDLDHLLTQYKKNPDNSLSALIRSLLCQHYGVDEDDLYVPYHLTMIDGEWTLAPNNQQIGHDKSDSDI